MSRRSIAKFYRSVSVSRQAAGHSVLLDERPIKTPGGRILNLPTEALADATAAEWREQDARIEPTQMPLTGLAYAAIDLFPDRRDEVINHVLGFGRSDLVCYRAEAPQELVARQAAAWDPVLDWLRRERGIELRTGAGLRFVEQPPAAQQSIAALVGALDGFALVALDRAAGLTGSLVLGLAMLSDHLDAAGAFSAAHVDENFQADKWGRDAQAEARLAHMQEELAAAERFLRLARHSRP